MTNSKGIEISVLNAGESEKVIQTVELLHGSFAGSDRYTVSRLNEELKPLSEPLYRQFFIAMAHTRKADRVIGVGGIKAADWASNTHILYLSAVHPDFRNQGIGKKLVRARVEWIRANFSTGRVLVSTPKIDRFRQFGFKQVSKSCEKGRALMLMEY
jgi:GNAT superfamily N-acetyltransferase